jgi:hypothetical protein
MWTQKMATHDWGNKTFSVCWATRWAWYSPSVRRSDHSQARLRHRSAVTLPNFPVRHSEKSPLQITYNGATYEKTVENTAPGPIQLTYHTVTGLRGWRRQAHRPRLSLTTTPTPTKFVAMALLQVTKRFWRGAILQVLHTPSVSHSDNFTFTTKYGMLCLSRAPVTSDKV